MSLIWWVLIIFFVLIIGIIGIAKWTFRSSKKGYDHARRRYNERRKK